MRKAGLNLLLLILLVIFQITIMAQVDIPRQTLAITYPQGETVKVSFRGTTRFPRVSGEATIKRTARNVTEIDLSVSKMPRPFELGASYTTYVLWAISPDGTINNLGEIKRRGTFEFDSKIKVTTPLQTFALIVTAEPHFLARRPSRAVMLENVAAVALSGKVLQTTQIINYFGNTSDYFLDARAPEIAESDYARTPSTILQARQAVVLARYVGAGIYAEEELREAESLLKKAEDAWRAGRNDREVEVLARQAIGAAVRAEDTAIARREARKMRDEKIRAESEIRQVEEKYQEAQNEIRFLKEELAREKKFRELSERDIENLNRQTKILQEENARLREEISKLRKESEETKTKLAKIEGEKEALERQRQREEKLARLKESIPAFMQSLKPFGQVRQTERGIILILPENYFRDIRSVRLTEQSEIKLINLATVLANNPDYRIVVESHTDDKGSPGELLNLTQARAGLIAQKLIEGGVDAGRIETKGFGASIPVAPNNNNLNRAKNRRIEVVLTPNF
jgi:outer membrane protein OmpA-like peptidoglycan-associated protein